MVAQTLLLKGIEYVVVPRTDFEQLEARAKLVDESFMPELPAKSPDGTYPALAAARVVLARKLIDRRQKLGWSQAKLAKLAKVRVETLNRIERCKVTADPATVKRLDSAMNRAKASRSR